MSGREPAFGDLTVFVKVQAGIANTRYGLLVSGNTTRRSSKELNAPTKKGRNSDSRYQVLSTQLSESNVERYAQ